MQNESKSIDLLKNLLKIVVENTKLNFDGKPANTKKETKHFSKLLETLLGRCPTQNEIDHAQRY